MIIVHVVVTDGYAGVEAHVARLAAGQARAGHRVTIVGGRVEQVRTVAGADVTVVPGRTIGQAVRYLRLLPSAPNIVHAHMTKAELATALYRPVWTHRTPMISTRHFAAVRGASLPGRLVGRLVRSRVAAQIAISRFTADRIDGDSTVVFAGVEPQPRVMTSADREHVVLMAQRLEEEKNAELGIRVFAASGLADQGWRLRVAGDGSQRAAIEALVDDLSVGDAVDFLGHRTDVPELMERASVFLAPTKDEHYGLSVLEAMAAGLPILAHASGGYLELLEGLGPDCFFDDDLQTAGIRLAQMANDAAARDRLGEAEHRRQQEHFGLSTQVEATTHVYRNALEGPAMRRRSTARHPGPGFVVLSLESWDDIWRRNQYLIAGLLRGDPTLRVLFVEPAADPVHDLTRRARPRIGRGLRRGQLDGISTSQLWLYQSTKVLPRRLSPWGDKFRARSIRFQARRIGLHRALYWFNDPDAAALLPLIDGPGLYDITDDWLAAVRPPAEHERLASREALLLQQCAEVTVCSPTLAASKGRHRPVTLVTNAVDLERYRRPTGRPTDLPSDRVVVYVGTLHSDRLDVQLTADTSLSLDGRARVVLVGPNALEPEETASLEAAGVDILGARRFESIPGYLQHADVLIVPHVVDAFTDSLDPIKLYEYLSVGRPVVTTPVAGFRNASPHLITLAERSEFVGAVFAALNGVIPTQLSRADIPTWDDQVSKMRDVIARARGCG